jgi:hypothetical protein
MVERAGVPDSFRRHGWREGSVLALPIRADL